MIFYHSQSNGIVKELGPPSQESGECGCDGCCGQQHSGVLSHWGGDEDSSQSQ